MEPGSPTMPLAVALVPARTIPARARQYPEGQMLRRSVLTRLAAGSALALGAPHLLAQTNNGQAQRLPETLPRNEGSHPRYSRRSAPASAVPSAKRGQFSCIFHAAPVRRRSRIRSVRVGFAVMETGHSGRRTRQLVQSTRLFVPAV